MAETSDGSFALAHMEKIMSKAGNASQTNTETGRKGLLDHELDTVTGGISAVDAAAELSFPSFNDGRPLQTLPPCGSGTDC